MSKPALRDIKCEVCDYAFSRSAWEENQGYCPNCDQPMILRKGRFGSFLGCSAYPECKTTQQIDKEGNPLPPKAPPKETGLTCPKCGKKLAWYDNLPLLSYVVLRGRCRHCGGELL